MPSARLVGLILLLTMLSAATIGVVSALEAAQWAGLWPSLFLGSLLAWTLGSGSMRSGLAWIILVAVGAATALVFGGGLVPTLARFGASVWEAARELWAHRSLDQAAMLSSLSALRTLAQAAVVIMQRTQGWFLRILRGQPDFDPAAAAVAWSAAIWLISAWAGWFAGRRQDGVLASLPSLLLAGATLSDADEGMTPLLVALAAAFMASAVMQHDQRERSWSENSVRFPGRKGQQIGRWAAVLTLGIVGASAMLSSQTVKSMWDAWTEPKATRLASEGGLGESLGIRSGQTSRGAPEDARSPGMPRERLLTLGPDLAARPVMTVQLGEPLTGVPVGITVPFYWRSFTYDVYTGRGWRTSPTETYDVPASAVVGEVESIYQRPVELIIHAAGEALTVIHTDGNLRRADRPVILEQRGPGDQFGGLISPTDQVEVQSIVAVAPATVLRQAGRSYPASIADRYLQLPADVPDRVRRLAIELTSAETTPYDQARAIERYLRTIPYSLEVSRPPLGRDVADYFLFDVQSGYCDYYATAMVVLSRIAGIPARLAIGFASGEYSEKTQRFLVLESDAHSWAELYFPGVGWLPFEPTAARPSIDRIDAAGLTEPPLETAPADLPKLDGESSRGRWPAVIFAVVLIGTVGVWAAIDEIRLRRSSLANTADAIYAQLRRYAARLGVPIDDSVTPFELARSMRIVLRRIARTSPWAAPDVTPLERNLAAVVEGLVLTYYQPAGPRQTADESAIPRTWARLRWDLRRMWLAYRLTQLWHRLGRTVAAFRSRTPSDVHRGFREIS